jgi:hypothetical protein
VDDVTVDLASRAAFAIDFKKAVVDLGTNECLAPSIAHGISLLHACPMRSLAMVKIISFDAIHIVCVRRNSSTVKRTLRNQPFSCQTG